MAKQPVPQKRQKEIPSPDGEPVSNSSEEILGRMINKIGAEKDADVYLFGGPLERSYENAMLMLIQHKKNRKKNAVLHLDTYGGHADAAYKIAKAFKRNYDRLTVMVFSDCKSAGTLLCLGADELVMSDLAELGPLDVQIPKEGEFSGRRSGLDITDTLVALQSESIRLMRQHFIDLRLGFNQQISTRDALDNAAKIVCGLLAPVYSQINPLSLGESARSNSIAFHYGQRLSKGNLHPGALNKLISGYPSHGFVIDREEANELFISARPPSPSEELLMLLVLQKYEQLASRRRPLILCLSDDYPSPQSKQEKENVKSEQVSGIKPSVQQPENRDEPGGDRAGSDITNDGGADGDRNGGSQPDAGVPGAKGGNITASGAKKTPTRVRKIKSTPPPQ
ncbi:SDH family Clp fold serine proteinase [Pseudomonas chlororaphis]|uniref:SDH family Clp fold serine proteinase n=1 Tax=Pseudomonas chlororaphis TaxID=587753 RepID=UPI000A516926|nr:hypothetical protein [Pseudomonas chlororaphis]AZD01356.1 hypothetical protein C4K27_2162 [Pseudomonas chlororaphis subsp. chlororaphis]MBM0285033.1 hypothetical protein [Pseudomonas chlororaphis]MDO1505706.1 hypothetical protein [Pseudomonas chlororaphis]WDG99726.1 hypothetical protein PUP54_09205 [Pseudomonas chlororaphis]WDH18732.1 hypothetical protein PUP70_11705 [Pseudomonas chlororaphis]